MQKGKIKICLAKDSDEDSRVEVGLNGKMFVILRGEEVSVEPAVYEILVNAGLISAKGHSVEAGERA